MQNMVISTHIDHYLKKHYHTHNSKLRAWTYFPKKDREIGCEQQIACMDASPIDEVIRKA